MIKNIKSQTDLSGFYIIYKGSTLLEHKGVYGISHLMEHLVCKSYDKYQDELDVDGITANAYTSVNDVVFHFTGLEENLSKWKNKLLNSLLSFDITKEQFETERSIVIQEYLDTFNDQSSAHFYNFLREKYGSYGAIGLKSDLMDLTYMDCLEYFSKQFSKPDYIINVSKNDNFSTNIQFADRNPDKVFSISDNVVPIERVARFDSKESVVIYCDGYNENQYLIKFLSNMLSFGLQSPLYNEVREKRGLAYYIFMQGIRLNNTSAPMISTMTTPNKVDEVYKVILDVISNRKQHITPKRFELIKSALINGYKISKINRYSNVGKYLEPNVFNLENKIENIEFEQIYDFSEKFLDPDNFKMDTFK